MVIQMKKIMMIFAVLALVMLAACETRVIMPEDEDVYTLNVQGKSDFDVAPDQAVLRIRVETQDMDAQKAQDQARVVANQVMTALKAEGVRSDEVETAEYNIQKVQEWNPELRKSEDKGYRVYNVLKVTTGDLVRVGDYLDAAVQAGANRIDSVDFQLSDSLEAEVKTEALQKAGSNARLKAQALADSMGVRLGRLRSVSEGMVNFQPYRMAVGDVALMGAEKAPTPIAPESVRINAEVSVSYDIA